MKKSKDLLWLIMSSAFMAQNSNIDLNLTGSKNPNGIRQKKSRKGKNQRHFELKKKRNRKMNQIQRKSRQQNR